MWTHMFHRHFGTGLCATVLLLSVAACSRFGGQEEPTTPPDYVKVSAVELAPAEENPFASFTPALAGTLKAEAIVAHDTQIADPAQAALIARAEARRKALRALGKAILAVTDKDGQTLDASLKAVPEKQAELNNLLETQANVTYQETNQGSRAQASLPGPRVLEALGKPTAAQLARRGQPDPQKDEQRRQRSYALAVEKAKSRLEEELLATKVSDTQTLKELVDSDPDIQRQFKAQLFLIKPDEVVFQDDGACKVTLFFDRNLVRALAEQRQGGLLKWFKI